jgi:hypothetical protein
MPEQIYPGESFSDGQQVNALRLNDHVSNAILRKGAITEQTINSTVDTADELIFVDVSASTLNKTTVGSLLNNNIPVIAANVTTSEIISPDKLDIVLRPDFGDTITGATFSSNGLDVTVNKATHGLVVGNVITVVASNSNFSGTFAVSSVTTNAFIYRIYATVTAASGTITSYTKQATILNYGHISTYGNVFVLGLQKIFGNLYVSGNATISGNVAINGNLDVTGTLQVNGTTAYVLYSITEQVINAYSATVASAWNLAFTSNDIIKPSDEIWEFTVDAPITYGREQPATFRTTNNAQSQTFRDAYFIMFGSATATGSNWYQSWTINSGTEFGTVGTPEKVKISIYPVGATPEFATISTFTAMSPMTVLGKLTIKKYKTA